MSMTGSYLAADGPSPGPSPDRRAFALTSRDFLIAAFFHIRIVLLAALIPLAIGVTAATLTKTQYTANSLLMVMVSREVSNTQNVTDSGPSVLSIEGLKQVESEVKILESADIIRTVIETIGSDRLFPPGPLARLRSLLGGRGDKMDRAIEDFRARLRAEVLDGSNIVQVSFTHPDRDIAIETTNKLVETYLTRRRALMETPTASILMTEVARFSRELKAADAAIEAFKARIGIIDFAQDATLAANQVDTVVQRRQQTAERKVSVAGQLAEAERQLNAQPATVFDFNQRANTLDNDDDHNTLTRLLIERDRLAMLYAPNGAMMREINRKIDTIRQQLATRGDRNYETSRDVRNPSIAYLNNMILNLRVEADALDRQESELADQQAKAERRLSDLRAAETELVELTRRRDTLNDGYREYQRRATAAQIEEAASRERESNVRLVQDAGASVTSRSLRLPYLGAGLLGAALFGVAAGAVASALRSTFILPHEVEHELELPMLGEFANQSRASDPAARERELGNLAALLLEVEIDGQPLRVMQLIAAEKDEHLSALAQGIAAEITTQRGMRTLLVDLTAPSAAVVPGDIAVRDKGGLNVAPSSTPLLWTAVGRESSPLLNVRIPLLEAERLMGELRAEFDAILFCASAADATAIGHRLDGLVDGNVLVIRAERTRKAAAIALRDSISESSGVPLGFILVGRRYVLPNWLYRLS